MEVYDILIDMICQAQGYKERVRPKEIYTENSSGLAVEVKGLKYDLKNSNKSKVTIRNLKTNKVYNFNMVNFIKKFTKIQETPNAN